MKNTKKKMSNKKQILTAIAAVLISVGLVATAVYAVTTVGDDVAVGNDLTVTGTTTLTGILFANGGITVDTNNFMVDGATGVLSMTVATTTGNLAAILIDAADITGTTTGLVIDLSNITGGTHVESGLSIVGDADSTGNAIGIALDGTVDFGITMSAATINTADIVLQNGEIIKNTTDGTIDITGKVVITGSRMSTSTDYENFLEVTGDITNATGSAKTRGILVEMTRPVTAPTYGGDIDDCGIMVRVDTEATSIIAGNTLRGIDAEAKADNPGGTITNIYGGSFTGKSDGSAGPVGTMWGLSTNVQNNSVVTSSLISADIRLMRQASPDPDEEYVMRIRSGSTSGTGVDAGLYFKSDGQAGYHSSAEFDYIIDMSAATTTVADIRLSNGEIIDNTVNGVISFGSANVTTTGSVGIGDGTYISKHISATTSLTLGIIPGQSCGTSTNVVFSGATLGDTVIASPDPATNGVEDKTVSWNAYVSIADTLTLRVCNATTTAETVAAQDWRFDLWKH